MLLAVVSCSSPLYNILQYFHTTCADLLLHPLTESLELYIQYLVQMCMLCKCTTLFRKYCQEESRNVFSADSRWFLNCFLISSCFNSLIENIQKQGIKCICQGNRLSQESQILSLGLLLSGFPTLTTGISVLVTVKKKKN